MASIDGEAVVTWQDARWLLLKRVVSKQGIKIETRNDRGEIHFRTLETSGLTADDLDGDFLEKLGLTHFRPLLKPVAGKLVAGGHPVGKEEFKTAVRVLEEDPSVDLVEFFADASIPAAVKRLVAPRNLKQRGFLQAVGRFDIVFAVGPAGTGKTYLAALAVSLIALGALLFRETELA